LEPTIYRITVRGRLTKRLMSAFEGLNVEPGIEQTALVGEIRDQSHLYGVLDLMRELGLDLVSLETNRGTSGPDDEESARLKGSAGLAARHLNHPGSPAIAGRGDGNVSLDQATFTGPDHRLLTGFGAERAVDRP
jgi:hypothetical protein